MDLVRPHPSFKASYLAALDEMTLDSDRFAWVHLGDPERNDFPVKDFDGYVREQLMRLEFPAARFVPDLIYWAVEGTEMLGRVSLRLQLNAHLSKVGGHIGYIVRPSARGRGIATEMLRRILGTPEARAIGRLLLTCDETNSASARTILKNGGRLETTIEIAPDKPRKQHYWISLPPGEP